VLGVGRRARGAGSAERGDGLAIERSRGGGTAARGGRSRLVMVVIFTGWGRMVKGATGRCRHKTQQTLSHCQKMRMYFSGPLKGGGLNSVDNVSVFLKIKVFNLRFFLELR
jgi:hypothetical protein